MTRSVMVVLPVLALSVSASASRGSHVVGVVSMPPSVGGSSMIVVAHDGDVHETWREAATREKQKSATKWWCLELSFKGPIGVCGPLKILVIHRRQQPTLFVHNLPKQQRG